VGFHLETDGHIRLEFNHAGIVGKNRNAPVFIQFLRRLENRLFEQVAKADGLAVMFHLDGAL